MHPTQWRAACRLTLFSRPSCGLCDTAAAVLVKANTRRQPLKVTVVNIIEPGNKAWKDIYDFDVPVLHIRKSDAPEEQATLAHKAVKLMHKFTAEEVWAKIDEVEKAE